MDHLLAKVKRKQALLRVLSDNDIYIVPALDNTVIYNPATLLEDGQWYRIEEFFTKDYNLPFLQENFVAGEYNQISQADYLKIDYLCSIQGNLFCFQKIFSGQLIKKNWFNFSNEPTIQKDRPVIILNQEPDAIYNSGDDILYFKKLPPIKNIFKGIDVLYREATDAETQEFLNSEFITLSDGFGFGLVKVPNRKRIAMLIDTLNGYSDEQKQDIFGYIREYCGEIPFENESFTIASDNDLQNILWGLGQRFYKTHVGEEKRIANSYIPIP